MINEGPTLSVAITYMEHFAELNVSAISLEHIKPEDVYVNKEGNIMIGPHKIKILPENTFALKGLEAEGFEAKSSDSWHEVSFHLNCKAKKPLPKFEESSSVLPTSEILNDDIFCHRHNHDHDQRHVPLVDERTARHLNSPNQIRYLLGSKSAFDNLLIEATSLSPREYIYFEIIHPKLSLGSKKDLSKVELNKIILKRATIFDYRHLTWDNDKDEIKKLRESFETEWYSVTESTFNILLDSLEQNDLSMLHIRKHADDIIKQSYL